MTMMTWKCPNCWTKYEIDEKSSKALENKQDCKFCVRKDQNIPTTAEMDGLLTQEDMRGRFDLVFQCVNDNKWKVHPQFDGTYLPCDSCGMTDYDSGGRKSKRSYNPLTDNKKRVSNRLKKNAKS